MKTQGTQLRNLMESIDDIYDAQEDEAQPESASASELIQEIISSLKELTNQISSGSDEDQNALTSDLQNISDSLKELIGSSDDSDDEYQDDSDEELDEEYGTEGMGPTCDDDGTQNYENPQGSSYPERKGFVGM